MRDLVDKKKKKMTYRIKCIYGGRDATDNIMKLKIRNK